MFIQPQVALLHIQRLTLTLSSGSLAREVPVYHCHVWLRKKKENQFGSSFYGQVGHGSVRRCSHIMMFDQGKSKFSYGVNELMRMTLTQSPFCFSEANPGLFCRCLDCRASAFILLHRHGSSRLFIYSVLMKAVSLRIPCKAH